MAQITLEYHSGIYQLKSEQKINAPIEKVWKYFSNPENLNDLTPKSMAFKITSQKSNKAYAGQIISYKIEILPKIKSHWITEITHIQKNKLFVDEQRFGPYKMWHHEHHFKKLDNNNVLMRDIVSYKLPFGFLGRLLASKIVGNRVKNIFAFRAKAIDDFF